MELAELIFSFVFTLLLFQLQTVIQKPKMKILFTVAPAALVLLLFTVSAVAANSNAEFMARVNDWSRIADVHHECTDKVKSLEAASTIS